MSSFNIIAETNEATVVAKYTPEKRKSTDYQSEAELEKDFIYRLTQQGYEYVNIKDEKDLILASLAIHDGRKSGFVKQTYTLADHPLLEAQAIRENELLDNIIPSEWVETICQNVSAHMGQWNTDYRSGKEILPKPVGKMQNMVHLCDYLASRKCLEMNFEVELSQ